MLLALRDFGVGVMQRWSAAGRSPAHARARFERSRCVCACVFVSARAHSHMRARDHSNKHTHMTAAVDLETLILKLDAIEQR